MRFIVRLLAVNTTSDFLRGHLIVVALLASMTWFYAGRQYFAKGNLVGAFLWEIIAILVLVAFCINVILSPVKSWFSLGVAIVAICIELWLIRRWISDTKSRP